MWWWAIGFVDTNVGGQKSEFLNLSPLRPALAQKSRQPTQLLLLVQLRLRKLQYLTPCSRLFVRALPLTHGSQLELQSTLFY
jgi:hypothetical protein